MGIRFPARRKFQATANRLLQEPLRIGGFDIHSRLIVGTGKYSTYELMRDALAASGCEVVTVAVRRERMLDGDGRNILDFLDPAKYTLLPNTAGCFSAAGGSIRSRRGGFRTDYCATGPT